MSDLVKVALIGAVVYFGTTAYQKQQKSVPENPSVPSGELSKHVPAEHRGEVGAFYRGFSVVVADGGCTTLGDFREAQKLAVSTFKKSGKLPDLTALNAPVDAALQKAVGGLDDVALDAQKRKALSDALGAIAADFGG